MTRFHTVGLLVSLFKAVCGKSNEESIKLLSGYDGLKTIDYSPMTLSVARKEIEDLLASNIRNDLLPVFMIDEKPPPADDEESFVRCILLRNFIRCMQCVCLLSGTEAAAMNAIDNIPFGSRGTMMTFEYLRLIVKLPSTQWSIYEKDPKY